MLNFKLVHMEQASGDFREENTAWQPKVNSTFSRIWGGWGGKS